ncbi:transposable element Tcb2 transposase [Trichonephila clavipes]|nr:transposable element Tcb2 transposase [Trichonephila clavipes]
MHTDGKNIYCTLKSQKNWYRPAPTRVTLLTVQHKALCLDWARQHRHCTVDDGKQVASSDESRFQLNRVDGGVRVWRQPRESMKLPVNRGLFKLVEAL